MNVLLVDQFAELGGAQRCFLDLAPALSAAGWRVTAALPGEGPYAERLRALGAEVELFPMGKYSSGRKGLAEQLRFAAEAPRLARELRAVVDRTGPPRTPRGALGRDIGQAARAPPAVR